MAFHTSAVFWSSLGQYPPPFIYKRVMAAMRTVYTMGSLLLNVNSIYRQCKEALVGQSVNVFYFRPLNIPAPILVVLVTTNAALQDMRKDSHFPFWLSSGMRSDKLDFCGFCPRSDATQTLSSRSGDNTIYFSSDTPHKLMQSEPPPLQMLGHRYCRITRLLGGCLSIYTLEAAVFAEEGRSICSCRSATAPSNSRQYLILEWLPVRTYMKETANTATSTGYETVDGPI